ncbi:DUF4234 domain-containing protein [Caldifermentibacillus hisashii]|uniref:DUF4234 domain-containing protein n=1 Tax=Caldifermentibacillus hisashii TaxID=996558 RepID=A0ABU9K2E3_9BACI
MKEKRYTFKEKPVFPLFLLSLLTFGIYYLYWVYVTTKQWKTVKNDNRSPAKDIILGIITLRIYFIFWHYKMAKELYDFAQQRGYHGIPEQSVLCAAISILPIGDYISMGLIQTNLNTLQMLKKERIHLRMQINYFVLPRKEKNLLSFLFETPNLLIWRLFTKY